jgi:hypothetical protein
MFTKTILFAILTACGAHSQQATSSVEPLGDHSVDNVKAATEQPPPDDPDKVAPREDIQEDQHFCCQSVDPKAMTGNGCVIIGQSQIDQCAEVLYCAGSWAKHDGKVSCE